MTTVACLSCGRLTTNGSRCADCQPEVERRRNPQRRAARRIHDTVRWRRLSRKVRGDWIVEHGLVCPGWKCDPHPVSKPSDLHADHVIPVNRGGAPYDPKNCGVLCGSCNGRKSDSENDGCDDR